MTTCLNGFDQEKPELGAPSVKKLPLTYNHMALGG